MDKSILDAVGEILKEQNANYSEQFDQLRKGLDALDTSTDEILFELSSKIDENFELIATTIEHAKNVIESVQHGKDGVDGKDGVAPTAEEITNALRADDDFMLSIKAMPAKDGIDGKDGEDADPEVVKKLITEDAAFVDSLKGVDGKDGEDGLNADPEQVKQLIVEDSDFKASLKGEKGDSGDVGIGLNTKAWSEGIYRKDTFVTHHVGQYYKALKDTTDEPNPESDDWERFGGVGFRHTGPFKADKTYFDGDLFVKDYGLFLYLNGKNNLIAGRGEKGLRGEKGKDGVGIDGKDGKDGRNGSVIIEKETRGPMLVEIVEQPSGELQEFYTDLTPMLEATAKAVLIDCEAKTLDLIKMSGDDAYSRTQFHTIDRKAPPINFFRGMWQANMRFKRGDLAVFGDSMFIALDDNQADPPLKAVHLAEMLSNSWQQFLSWRKAFGDTPVRPSQKIALVDLYTYVADGTKKIFNGADRAGAILTLDPAKPLPVDVYVGGVKLTETRAGAAGDYTINYGTSSVTLAKVPRSGTIVELDVRGDGAATSADNTFEIRTTAVLNGKAGANVGNKLNSVVSPAAAVKGMTVYVGYDARSGASNVWAGVWYHNGTGWHHAVDLSSVGGGANGTYYHTTAAVLRRIANTATEKQGTQVLENHFGGLFTGAVPSKSDIVYVDAGSGRDAPYGGVFIYDGAHWKTFASSWAVHHINGFTKALVADADANIATTLSPEGSIQATLEAGHKELKVVDDSSAWQMLFSEIEIKQWIAAGSLFQGTVDQTGLVALPATANNMVGWYWTYQDPSGASHTLSPADGQLFTDLGAITITVSDWLQVVPDGTGTKWAWIHGDVLTKTHWIGIGSFNTWSAGSYEQHSLVKRKVNGAWHYFSATADITTPTETAKNPEDTTSLWADITPAPNPEGLGNIDSTANTPIDEGTLVYDATGTQWQIKVPTANVPVWADATAYKVGQLIFRKPLGVVAGDAYTGSPFLARVINDATSDPANDAINWEKVFAVKLNDLPEVAFDETIAVDQQILLWNDTSSQFEAATIYDALDWKDRDYTTNQVVLDGGDWYKCIVDIPAATALRPSADATNWKRMGIDKLNDLSDVSTVDATGTGGSDNRPSNADVLSWNATDGEWQPTALTGQAHEIFPWDASVQYVEGNIVAHTTKLYMAIEKPSSYLPPAVNANVNFGPHVALAAQSFDQWAQDLGRTTGTTWSSGYKGGDTIINTHGFKNYTLKDGQQLVYLGINPAVTIKLPSSGNDIINGYFLDIVGASTVKFDKLDIDAIIAADKAANTPPIGILPTVATGNWVLIGEPNSASSNQDATVIYMGHADFDPSATLDRLHHYGMDATTTPNPQVVLPQAGDRYLSLDTAMMYFFQGTAPNDRISSTITSAHGVSISAKTSLHLDGSNSPKQNIPWGGKKITGLGDATADDEAVNLKVLEHKVNEILNGLSHGIEVQSATTTTPPTPSAANLGKVWIVPKTTGTGAWVGHGDALAIVEENAGNYVWYFETPTLNEAHFVEDTNKTVHWNGTDWSVIANAGTAAAGTTVNGVGEIVGWTTSGALPDGLLALEGQILAITTYPELHSAIGNTYNAGTGADGTSTFAVPDLRGYFLRGDGLNADGTGATGRAVGSKQGDQNKAHRHSLNYGTDNAAYANAATTFSSGGNTWSPSGTVGQAPSGVVNADGGTEVRVKNLAVRWCIRTKGINAGVRGPTGKGYVDGHAVGDTLKWNGHEWLPSSGDGLGWIYDHIQEGDHGFGTLDSHAFQTVVGAKYKITARYSSWWAHNNNYINFTIHHGGTRLTTTNASAGAYRNAESLCVVVDGTGNIETYSVTIMGSGGTLHDYQWLIERIK